NLKIDLVSYNQKSRQFGPLLAGARAGSASFSLDGKYVAYTTFDYGDLWRMNVDVSERRRLRASPIHGVNPAWSPNGKQIAFVSLFASNCQNKIYLVNVEGGPPRELFPNDCEQFDPAWSPDGKVLGFGRIEKLPSGAEAPSTIQL